ncbi:MAG: MarR family transcriptional regulator [Minicystis sp.]
MARRRSPSHPLQISPLDAHLGYWLRFVSNHVSHAFSVKLSGRDVTVAEWVAMRELFEHDSVAPSKLADDLGMTRGAISKLIDWLSAKGLVIREQGEGDRRYQFIGLTAAGRALVPELGRARRRERRGVLRAPRARGARGPRRHPQGHHRSPQTDHHPRRLKTSGITERTRSWTRT